MFSRIITGLLLLSLLAIGNASAQLNIPGAAPGSVAAETARALAAEALLAPLANPNFTGTTNNQTEATAGTSTAALFQVSGASTGTKINLFSNTYGSGINPFEYTDFTAGGWCVRSGTVTGPIIGCVSANAQFWLNAAIAPTISACGTTPALSATAADSHGTVTEGTTSTGCTVTFQSAFLTTPDCTVSSQTGTVLTSYTVATNAITWVHSSASNAKITYICIR